MQKIRAQNIDFWPNGGHFHNDQWRPSFENIVSRHKEKRNLTRHAGSGKSSADVEDKEHDSSKLEINIDDIEELTNQQAQNLCIAAQFWTKLRKVKQRWTKCKDDQS